MTDNAIQSPLRLLDIKEVRKRIPLSRSSIYSMMERGEFPQSVRFTANRVAWDSRVIDQWIEQKLA